MVGTVRTPNCVKKIAERRVGAARAARAAIARGDGEMPMEGSFLDGCRAAHRTHFHVAAANRNRQNRLTRLV
jgi:hypothetical protein